MADDKKQLEKPNTTFRFSSGQVLALDEHQIATIPYLAAMVSSADHFHSARDEDGHYKLDPNINHQHFSLILQLLPFHSVRQVFSCLPEEEENVIPIVALLDFLGLLPYSLPSLEEVNSTFFCTLIYSPYYGHHFELVHTDVLQDMAVRFAIAMIKEEYDFDDCRVMDQIYWFVMFILSADRWFEGRLRHHVHTTAKNCFALFNPSLLKHLEKVMQTSEKKSSFWWNNFLRLNEKDTNYYRETYFHFYDKCDECCSNRWHPLFHISNHRSTERHFVCSIYGNRKLYSLIEKSVGEDPLGMVDKLVLEIMYARLQTEICQCAVAELHHSENASKCVSTGAHTSESIPSFEAETLPKKIHDIFKRQQVQEDIDALILEIICSLTPKLQEEHAKLVKRLREYEETSDDEYGLFWDYWTYQPYLSGRSVREKAVSYELFLDR